MFKYTIIRKFVVSMNSFIPEGRIKMIEKDKEIMLQKIAI